MHTWTQYVLPTRYIYKEFLSILRYQSLKGDNKFSAEKFHYFSTTNILTVYFYAHHRT